VKRARTAPKRPVRPAWSSVAAPELVAGEDAPELEAVVGVPVVGVEEVAGEVADGEVADGDPDAPVSLDPEEEEAPVEDGMGGVEVRVTPTVAQSCWANCSASGRS